ncbi:MAG: TIGR04282 family arsenosugar biosynthesis glycosyltransferase, partial [Flavobacteriales bacterium]|nr:TIGR04282 family arsenosugar biosynthesis glycosyltransferase [Flavobacteriales bacterium]
LEVSNSFLSKEQINGDLGERMCQAFEEVLQDFDAAVMIGTDCPEIASDLLLEAFEELNQNDVVFGPSEDGGYYLIGMKALHQELFQTIEWSTTEVLEKSILHAEKKQLKIGQIRQLNDVDTKSDLIRSSWVEWFKTTIEQDD